MDPRQLLADTAARLRALLTGTQANQRQIGGTLRAALAAHASKVRASDAARAAEQKQAKPYQPPPTPEAPAAPAPRAAPAAPSAAAGMQFTPADEKASIDGALAVGVAVAALAIENMRERAERAQDNDLSL
ncbi:hypothetical protein GALL_152240 [mine drainage metagenome]|uniref:Uncharacterized protein n=1 Tax=mine drainage metagenome TaxID=410659 RepID=A0A1J5S3U1_9ZZZZ